MITPLATTGTTRSPVYHDLPTVAEAGLPGYSVDLQRDYRPMCLRSSTAGSTKRSKTIS